MGRGILLAVLLATCSALGCSDNSAKALFETAAFEEKQNNADHAQELYREILTKYPTSDYAKKAQDRLDELKRRKEN